MEIASYVLYLPIQMILISTIFCRDGYHVIRPTQECWTAGHTVLSVFSIICFVINFALHGMYKYLIFPFDPKHGGLFAHLSGWTKAIIDLFANCQILVLSLMSFDRGYIALFTLIPSFCITLWMAYRQPFYSVFANCFYCCCFASYFVLRAFGEIDQFLTDSLTAHIILWVVGIVLLIPICICFCVYINKRYKSLFLLCPNNQPPLFVTVHPSTIDVDSSITPSMLTAQRTNIYRRLTSVFSLEHALRFLHNRKFRSQPYMDYAVELMGIAIKNCKRSSKLVFIYFAYTLSFRKQREKADNLLPTIKHYTTPYYMRFVLYCYQSEQVRGAINAANFDDRDHLDQNTLALSSVEMNNLENAVKYHVEACRNLKSCWNAVNHLSSKSKSIPILLQETTICGMIARKGYESLLQSRPNNYVIMKLLAYLLKDILRDDEQAEILIARAEQLDDYHTAYVGSPKESELSSISSGSKTQGTAKKRKKKQTLQLQILAREKVSSTSTNSISVIYWCQFFMFLLIITALVLGLLAILAFLNSALSSLENIMLVEQVGRYSGKIALYSKYLMMHMYPTYTQPVVDFAQFPSIQEAADNLTSLSAQAKDVLHKLFGSSSLSPWELKDCALLRTQYDYDSTLLTASIQKEWVDNQILMDAAHAIAYSATDAASMIDKPSASLFTALSFPIINYPTTMMESFKRAIFSYYKSSVSTLNWATGVIIITNIVVVWVLATISLIIVVIFLQRVLNKRKRSFSLLLSVPHNAIQRQSLQIIQHENDIQVLRNLIIHDDRGEEVVASEPSITRLQSFHSSSSLTSDHRSGSIHPQKHQHRRDAVKQGIVNRTDGDSLNLAIISEEEEEEIRKLAASKRDEIDHTQIEPEHEPVPDNEPVSDPSPVPIVPDEPGTPKLSLEMNENNSKASFDDIEELKVDNDENVVILDSDYVPKAKKKKKKKKTVFDEPIERPDSTPAHYSDDENTVDEKPREKKNEEKNSDKAEEKTKHKEKKQTEMNEDSENKESDTEPIEIVVDGNTFDEQDESTVKKKKKKKKRENSNSTISHTIITPVSLNTNNENSDKNDQANQPNPMIHPPYNQSQTVIPMWMPQMPPGYQPNMSPPPAHPTMPSFALPVNFPHLYPQHIFPSNNPQDPFPTTRYGLSTGRESVYTGRGPPTSRSPHVSDIDMPPSDTHRLVRSDTAREELSQSSQEETVPLIPVQQYDEEEEYEMKQMGIVRNAVDDIEWEDEIEKNVETLTTAVQNLPRGVNPIFFVLFILYFILFNAAIIPLGIILLQEIPILKKSIAASVLSASRSLQFYQTVIFTMQLVTGAQDIPLKTAAPENAAGFSSNVVKDFSYITGDMETLHKLFIASGNLYHSLDSVSMNGVAQEGWSADWKLNVQNGRCTAEMNMATMTNNSYICVMDNNEPCPDDRLHSTIVYLDMNMLKNRFQRKHFKLGALNVSDISLASKPWKFMQSSANFDLDIYQMNQSSGFKATSVTVTGDIKVIEIISLCVLIGTFVLMFAFLLIPLMISTRRLEKYTTQIEKLIPSDITDSLGLEDSMLTHIQSIDLARERMFEMQVLIYDSIIRFSNTVEVRTLILELMQQTKGEFEHEEHLMDRREETMKMEKADDTDELDKLKQASDAHKLDHLRLQQRLTVLLDSLCSQDVCVRHDCTFTLMGFLENMTIFPVDFFKQKTVLDYSCGTGVCGILLSMLCPNMTISIPSFHHDLVQRNIATNASKRSISVVQRSDFMDIVRMLKGQMGAGSVTILAYELRTREEVDLFKRLQEYFLMQRIPDTNIPQELRDDKIAIIFLKLKP
ncbi:hypothetical protein BLNAU_12700 [Blattamonas nauphoetae]|uniref:TmcB/TmcC TPR repeats domain-containing protein n=1 Tax=Blattamonas nauphoetae TaxID=2049346 RepID=A0ABQ9XJW0_9EUKA|nr:hypothetical protein BLNAU_12700 [Blattamonas nauphoetae]